MANIDISLARKLSVIAYLLDQPVELGELAKRFERTWSQMYAELYEIFMVEVPDGSGIELPFDLIIDDDGDVSAHTVVSLRVEASLDLDRPSLTLAEVISLVAVIDDLLRAADSSTSVKLFELRERLVHATGQAGYSSVLWATPQSVISPTMMDVLTQAMHDRRWVRIEYWRNDDGRAPHRVRNHVAPVAISTALNPLLIAANESEELRRFRIDRISSIEVTTTSFTKQLAQRIRKLASQPAEFTGEEVTLVCTRDARWIVEVIPGARIVDDGAQLRIALPVTSRSWLTSLAMRLGESLIDVEPSDARAHVTRMASSLCAKRLPGRKA